jgi:hypothetical protein
VPSMNADESCRDGRVSQRIESGPTDPIRTYSLTPTPPKSHLAWRSKADVFRPHF